MKEYSVYIEGNDIFSVATKVKAMNFDQAVVEAHKTLDKYLDKTIEQIRIHSIIELE